MEEVLRHRNLLAWWEVCIQLRQSHSDHVMLTILHSVCVASIVRLAEISKSKKIDIPNSNVQWLCDVNILE
jgi:hypothetical protein